MLPLLILVVGLAAATMWYVALPILEKESPRRSCEVIVLKSGLTRCVPSHIGGSKAVPRKAESSHRATQ